MNIFYCKFLTESKGKRTVKLGQHLAESFVFFTHSVDMVILSNRVNKTHCRGALITDRITQVVTYVGADLE